MKEKFAEIRTALDDLERQTEGAEAAQGRALVSGFELPDIIRDVVDLLLPELEPYEASLYLYLLRHSIVEEGSQHARVSTRKLQNGVVKSTRTGSSSGGKDASSGSISLQKIRGALARQSAQSEKKPIQIAKERSPMFGGGATQKQVPRRNSGLSGGPRATG